MYRVLAAHFVDGMATLMDDGVKGEDRLLLVVMGGDTDVLVVKARSKGVLRFGDGAIIPVDAQDGHDVIRQLVLLLHGIELVQEAIINGLRSCDLGQEGNQDFPELRKETVQGFGSEPFLIFVQQSVVGWQTGIVISGKFLINPTIFSRYGAKSAKSSVFLACSQTAWASLRSTSYSIYSWGWNFGNLVVRLSEQLNLSPVHWVQLLKMGLQIRQEGFVFRVGI